MKKWLLWCERWHIDKLIPVLFIGYLLWVSSCLIPTATVRHHYLYPHVTNQTTEAWKGWGVAQGRPARKPVRCPPAGLCREASHPRDLAKGGEATWEISISEERGMVVSFNPNLLVSYKGSSKSLSKMELQNIGVFWCKNFEIKAFISIIHISQWTFGRSLPTMCKVLSW